MGILQYEDNGNFNAVVKMLAELDYLSLSGDGIISINAKQNKKLEEFGFFLFLIVVYWSFENNLKVLTNKNSLKRCILFFPDKKLYPYLLFKTGEIINEMPKGNTILSDFDIAVFKRNLQIYHRKLKLPRGIKRWNGIYKLIKNDERYLCILGGKGIVLDVDASFSDLLIDLPEDNSLTSKLFDTFITILSAGYFSDTCYYCANINKFRKPFVAYEIDSFLVKIDCQNISDLDSPQSIKRLIVVETTLGGKLDNLSITDQDFFSNKKINAVRKCINIDGMEYISVKESNDTSFRNKISSWLAFKNIGVKNFCYILLNLKSGLLDHSWLDKQTTAITAYCLANTKSLEVVEMKCDDPLFYKNQLSNREMSYYLLKKPYKKLVSDYKKTLTKYK